MNESKPLLTGLELQSLGLTPTVGQATQKRSPWPMPAAGLLGGATGMQNLFKPISIPTTNAPDPGPRTSHVGLEQKLMAILGVNPLLQQQLVANKQDAAADFSRQDPLAQERAKAKPGYRWASAIQAGDDVNSAWEQSQRRP